MFVQGNVLIGLPFESDRFAFVHQRLLVLAIPSDAWPQVIAELVRVLRPGGMLELVEVGETFQSAGPATRQFLQWWQQSSRARGIEAARMGFLDPLLERVGMQQIRRKEIPIPLGTHGGRAGELFATDLLAVIQTLQPFCCRQLAVTAACFQEVVGALAAEWEQYRTTYTCYVYTASKGGERGRDE